MNGPTVVVIQKRPDPSVAERVFEGPMTSSATGDRASGQRRSAVDVEPDAHPWKHLEGRDRGIKCPIASAPARGR